MNTSSRFSTTIHILTLLAHMTPERVNSEFIAGSVNTNAVVIRRLLSLLRDAQVVSSRSGPGGGWQLDQKPASISLLDVFKLVEHHDLLPLPAQEPNPKCPVGQNIQAALEGHIQDAQSAFELSLSHVTIQDLLEDMDLPDI